MTAPARANGGASSPAKPRERALRTVPAERRRSAAAERAYARRAQRTSTRGPAVTRQPVVAPKAPFVVMVMIVLGVGIAAIMWLSTQATADSYRLQDARAEETRLARQVEQLRQDVALAESPLELAEAAAKLGLIPAGDPARLRLLPDGTVEVYGKPSAVEPPPPPAPSTTAPPTTTAAAPSNQAAPSSQAAPPTNQTTPADQAAQQGGLPPAQGQGGQQPVAEPVPGGQ